MTPFDDYLGLGARSFARDRLVVFSGASGSGKSTAIRFLLDEHPDFRGRHRTELAGPPFGRLREPADLAVVDDLARWRDAGAIARLLPTSRTLLVASHLDVAWFAPLRAVVRCSFFRTDRDEGKIGRALQRRGVDATPAAIRAYVASFGATYTDIDIILERCPAPTFDASLALFLKLCRLSASPLLPDC